jgi:hypothetical protein
MIRMPSDRSIKPMAFWSRAMSEVKDGTMSQLAK